MSIVRTSHDKSRPYVMLNNSSLEDKNLSWAAKGLWAYLISRPDNWNVSVSHLVKTFGNSGKKGGGEKAIYTLLNELIEKGYCVWKQGKSTNGKFLSSEYTIFETPQIKIISPHRPDAGAVNAVAVKGGTNNNQCKTNTDVNKDNVRKKTMSSCTHDKKDNGKALSKFKLNESQANAFSWLKSLSLNTDDNTLSYWAKTFSLARLNAVYDCAKKGAKSNIGGYMNALLKKNAQVETEQSKINKQTAQNFKKEFGFGAMTVLENYVRIDLSVGSTNDISYQLDPMTFYEQLMKAYELQ